MDNFSGYLRLYSIPQPTAKDTTGALLQYICINSMPLKIVTDNRPEFANELFTELFNLMGLKQTTISSYNSKSNGQVEWTHKVTKSILQAYVNKFRDDWDLLVPLVEFAFNTSQSSSTTYTPFQVHFRQPPIIPLNMMYGSVYWPYVTRDEYVSKLQTN